VSTFPIHNLESAPETSGPHLEAAQSKFGMIPNLLGVLATAPVALATYLKTTVELEGSSLSPIEQQVVFVATSVENGCEYCVSVHSAISGMVGMHEDALGALRSGAEPADTRLAALTRFVRAVVRERGWVTPDELKDFGSAGFDERAVLEVITGVALKTLSNYANHIVDTPLDAAFEAARWEARAAA
jgi:uncharacterized peroxidase-related enzyme